LKQNDIKTDLHEELTNCIYCPGEDVGSRTWHWRNRTYQTYSLWTRATNLRIFCAMVETRA